MCALYTAVHVGGPVQSRWYWVVGSSQHLLSLPSSLCRAVLGRLLCAVSGLGRGLGIESVGVSGGHKRGKQCAVVCVANANKLGVSCVLPALTCWVELCTDRTCISPLGTVGSAAHAHYTDLNVSAGHVFTIIIKY